MCLPLLVAAFGLAFHLGGKEVHRFERLVESNLSQQIGTDVKNVSVQVKLGGFELGHLTSARIEANSFTIEELPLKVESWRSKAGKIDTLQIHLTDFTLGKLPVKDLRVTLKGCRWDVSAAMRDRQLHISRSGKGTFEAIVDDEGLKTYLIRRFPLVKPSLVAIDPYKVTIEGQLATPFGSPSFFALSKCLLTGPRTLSLEPAFLSFDGSPASESLKATFLKALNPILDLDRDFNLYGALSMTGIRFLKGEMIIVGSAIIPEENKKSAIRRWR